MPAERKHRKKILEDVYRCFHYAQFKGNVSFQKNIKETYGMQCMVLLYEDAMFSDFLTDIEYMYILKYINHLVMMFNKWFCLTSSGIDVITLKLHTA